MKNLAVYLEIDGLAEDEYGNPAPAGVEITLGEVSDEIYDKYSYDVLTQNLNPYELLKNLGLVDTMNIKEDCVRVISPEYFVSEYVE